MFHIGEQLNLAEQRSPKPKVDFWVQIPPPLPMRKQQLENPARGPVKQPRRLKIGHRLILTSMILQIIVNYVIKGFMYET